ncbi:hypothetical protein EGK14_11680 [Erwinia sp. 198]|nr:hypothetical protein EGK14_11680 [Erwinia sp. 198]
MTGECSTKFSLTFSGGSTSDGNFLLGDDVAMKLSYNYGADRIINGQPFSPAASQIVDVALSSLTPGTTPAAGSKTATLTVTLNLL